MLPAENKNSVWIHSGFLLKQGGFIKTWKKRFFVLTEEQLRYFEINQNQSTNTNTNANANQNTNINISTQNQKGSIPMAGSLVSLGSSSSSSYSFYLTPAFTERTYHFIAEDPLLRDQWIKYLIIAGATLSINNEFLAEEKDKQGNSNKNNNNNNNYNNNGLGASTSPAQNINNNNNNIVNNNSNGISNPSNSLLSSLSQSNKKNNLSLPDDNHIYIYPEARREGYMFSYKNKLFAETNNHNNKNNKNKNGICKIYYFILIGSKLMYSRTLDKTFLSEAINNNNNNNNNNNDNKKVNMPHIDLDGADIQLEEKKNLIEEENDKNLDNSEYGFSYFFNNFPSATNFIFSVTPKHSSYASSKKIIVKAGRKLVFGARDPADVRGWINALREAAINHCEPSSQSDDDQLDALDQQDIQINKNNPIVHRSSTSLGREREKEREAEKENGSNASSSLSKVKQSPKMNPSSIVRGHLWKFDSGSNDIDLQWKQRYFVLDLSEGKKEFRYWRSLKAVNDPNETFKTIDLSNFSMRFATTTICPKSNENKCTFVLQLSKSNSETVTIYLAAETQVKRDRWLSVLFPLSQPEPQPESELGATNGEDDEEIDQDDQDDDGGSGKTSPAKSPPRHFRNISNHIKDPSIPNNYNKNNLNDNSKFLNNDKNNTRNSNEVYVSNKSENSNVESNLLKCLNNDEEAYQNFKQKCIDFVKDRLNAAEFFKVYFRTFGKINGAQHWNPFVQIVPKPDKRKELQALFQAHYHLFSDLNLHSDSSSTGNNDSYNNNDDQSVSPELPQVKYSPSIDPSLKTLPMIRSKTSPAATTISEVESPASSASSLSNPSQGSERRASVNIKPVIINHNNSTPPKTPTSNSPSPRNSPRNTLNTHNIQSSQSSQVRDLVNRLEESLTNTHLNVNNNDSFTVPHRRTSSSSSSFETSNQPISITQTSSSTKKSSSSSSSNNNNSSPYPTDRPKASPSAPNSPMVKAGNFKLHNNTHLEPTIVKRVTEDDNDDDDESKQSALLEQSLKSKLEEEELKQKQQARIDEIAKIQREKDQSDIIRFQKREEISKLVNEWVKNSKKSIVVMLATLDQVFPSIKQGTFVPTSTQPQDVKKCWLRALLVIHPDKQGSSSSIEQQVRAELVFQAVTQRYEKFVLNLKKKS